MPTYLYECENCGRFEEFQKITAEPLSECPHCGGEVKRIIGQPGIIFKGSGFYSTDNSNKNTINTANSDTDKEKDNSKQPDNSKQTDNKENQEKVS